MADYWRRAIESDGGEGSGLVGGGAIAGVGIGADGEGISNVYPNFLISELASLPVL